MLRTINRILGAIAPWLLLVALVVFSPPQSCASAQDCIQPAFNGRQRFPYELAVFFDQAGKNEMGTSGPSLPQIKTGYPTITTRDPYVPCILLKAVGVIESTWKQYRANWGDYGDTVISSDYGYGIMQITTGMTSCDSLSFNKELVARSSLYNIGTGALFLIGKWNNTPSIGDNNPYAVEDWYYATWAYNGWGWVNNPNNTKFDPNRAPYDGSQARSHYPYQELVWGIAAHPPNLNDEGPAWTAQNLTLPPRSAITNPPGSHLDAISPAHVSCLNFVPTHFLYLPAMFKTGG